MPCAACSGPLAADSFSLNVCSAECLDAFADAFLARAPYATPAPARAAA